MNETHLAVVSGAGAPADRFLELGRPEIYGTAFPLDPAQYLFGTARHVYAQAREYALQQQDGRVAVGRIVGSRPQLQFVEEVEEFPAIDFAILRCAGLQTPRLDFDFRPLEYLSEVSAAGFPFAIRLPEPGETGVFYLRAFRGSIVTRRGLTELPAIPPGYETSFPAPPGLSGAPLMSLGRDLAVSGFMQGQYVGTLLHDPDRNMRVGVAIDIEELLTLDSGLAGGSIAERLFHRDRIDRGERTP